MLVYQWCPNDTYLFEGSDVEGAFDGAAVEGIAVGNAVGKEVGEKDGPNVVGLKEEKNESIERGRWR